MKPKSLVTGLAALAVVGLVGCAGGRPASRGSVTAPAGGVLLRGAGATFPSLLYKEWFTAYPANHPKVAVAYDVVGSGEGVRRFIGKDVAEADQIDFGASDAAMTDEQISAVSGGVLMVPMTAGSLVLAYNLPGFDGPLRLSRQAYQGIFLDEVRWWDDPIIAAANPGAKLPHANIAIVVRSDSSGTTYAFTNHLAASSERWRTRFGASTLVSWPGNAMRAPGNEGVAGRIKLSAGAIGYVNYGSARQAGLPMATLENKSGAFVEPTPQSGAKTLAASQLPENLRLFMPDPDGSDSYPIVTFSWILLHPSYADHAKSDALVALFRWCLTDGQRYAPDLGYVPLPPAVASKALAAVDRLSGPPQAVSN
ncbi:MAG TPA: phosphate ABC transporter substrate-binding protein PstS [Vicinamibacteria bacterium]|nr:phosphate ABC transporter substrate-binding protein PstS [Vicinamibacteria bacterium]